VSSFFALPVTAVAVACLCAFAAPRAQGFDFFRHDSPPPAPPADISGADQAPAFVLRLNRLEEELRQAYGRIEALENQEHRLEEQLQRFRQDVEYRFGDRTGAIAAPVPAPSPVASAPEAPPAPAIDGPAPKPRKSDAFDPDANPGAPGAPQPLGTSAPSAPLARPLPPPGSTWRSPWSP
jgi:TolA-binding protein